MTFKKFSQLLITPFVGCAFFPTTSVAALTTWDFDVETTHGWTAVQGEAFLAGNGVTAAQLSGEGGREGEPNWRGGVNGGASRNSHDGAHSTMIFRSPVLNFGAASATGSVLEIDWFGGEGKGGNVTLDPTSPADIVAGQTSGFEDGVKGMGLLNLTTGNYDAYSYKAANGGGIEVQAFSLAQLEGAGVSLTDDYQLDFFESDDGGWGWTRLEAVRIDEAAVTGVAPPRDPNIVVSNGTFLSSAIQGSQAGTLGMISGTAGDSYTYSLVAGEGSTDNAKFQIDGGELQIGPYDFSTTANNTRFSVRVRATGTPSGEQIEKAVLVTALAEPPPPQPGETVVWDFDVDVSHGWSAVQGEAFLAGNGVTAAQLSGEGGREGEPNWRGGANLGASRNSHDGAHSTMIFRSPVLNFANASATGSVLEIDWFGGEGKGGNVNLDPTSPADIVAGQTSGLEDGVKGMGLLNLTTGNYDAYSYKGANGGGIEVQAFTLAQLEGAGVSLTDDYQLDFFENDDGGWGWTRLEAVRIDGSAITGVAPPRDPNIVVSNGTFLSSAIQGSQVGTLGMISGTAGDSYTYTLVAGEGSTDNAKFQIDGGELQIGPYDFSTTVNNTRFSVRVRATGTPSGEQIEKAVLVTALAVSPPLPPGETVVWNFDADNEHGWTTVSGQAFLAGNGVTAGQANGEGGRLGEPGWRGGVNEGGTRNSHDGAHTNFIYRSPVINFGSASATGNVLEIDWFGGEGRGGNVTMDPTSPADIIGKTTGGNEDGVKGLGLLNLTTGNYDAFSYKDGNGGGTQTKTFTLDQLTEAGVSLTDSYQLDFFENDDGGWGWTRMEEVRIDPLAIGENSSSTFVITDIDYSPSDQQVTLTWNSRVGQIYAVTYSEDMIDWPGDLDDSIDADAGDQTTRTYNLRDAGFNGRVFFRVERQSRRAN
jgi:hypothetical protein